jgi:hypothetical protein
MIVVFKTLLLTFSIKNITSKISDLLDFPHELLQKYRLLVSRTQRFIAESAHKRKTYRLQKLTVNDEEHAVERIGRK